MLLPNCCQKVTEVTDHPPGSLQLSCVHVTDEMNHWSVCPNCPHDQLTTRTLSTRAYITPHHALKAPHSGLCVILSLRPQSPQGCQVLACLSVCLSTVVIQPRTLFHVTPRACYNHSYYWSSVVIFFILLCLQTVFLYGCHSVHPCLE